MEGPLPLCPLPRLGQARGWDLRIRGRGSTFLGFKPGQWEISCARDEGHPGSGQPEASPELFKWMGTREPEQGRMAAQAKELPRQRPRGVTLFFVSRCQVWGGGEKR